MGYSLICLRSPDPTVTNLLFLLKVCKRRLNSKQKSLKLMEDKWRGLMTNILKKW
jgi:hypothetical protein